MIFLVFHLRGCLYYISLHVLSYMYVRVFQRMKVRVFQRTVISFRVSFLIIQSVENNHR